MTHDRSLTLRTNEEQCSYYVLSQRRVAMLKIFIQEAAALASVALFIGMIAVWAQVLPQMMG